MKKHYIRIPLENAYNVRDLGGYACPEGKTTKWNNLVRADDLSNLTDSEVDFLVDYGVRCVIDLRSKKECEAHPDPFINDHRVRYLNIPLMDDMTANPTPEMLEKMDFSLGGAYTDMINNAQGQLKKVIEEIISSNGGVLFHCAGGKDRTGIVAMLLLGAVGVSESDIISNYETTYTHLKQNQALFAAARQYPIDIMMSKAEYLEKLLDYIAEKYTSISRFLLSIGLTDEMLSKMNSIICE